MAHFTRDLNPSREEVIFHSKEWKQNQSSTLKWLIGTFSWFSLPLLGFYSFSLVNGHNQQANSKGTWWQTGKNCVKEQFDILGESPCSLFFFFRGGLLSYDKHKVTDILTKCETVPLTCPVPCIACVKKNIPSLFWEVRVNLFMHTLFMELFLLEMFWSFLICLEEYWYICILMPKGGGGVITNTLDLIF